MIKPRPGDVNRKRQITFGYDAWIQPNGIIKTKPQGDLIGPRWCCIDNPINGIGVKENLDKIISWDNQPPWENY